VKTLGSGLVDLEITQPNSSCRNSRPAKLMVGEGSIVLRLLSGELACLTLGGQGCDRPFTAGTLKITSCRTEDPVFAMDVRKGKTVVKVTRGRAVVTGPGGRTKAVLVARNQQVAVPNRHDPPAPVPAVLTTKERKALASLQTKLPPGHDSTPPAAKIGSAPPKATASSTATFAFTAAERNVAFACSLDGAPFHPCSSPSSYTGLKPGAHTFAIIAVDTAGNTTSVAPYVWTIDTRAPVARITSQQPAVTSATSATFTFNADETSISFACQLDEAAFAPCSSPATYSGLASGTHTFSVRATDLAGNVGAPANSVSWTIDIRVPVVTISSGPAARSNVTDASFSFTADKSPVSFACQLDNTALTPCSSPKAYSRLAEDTHTFAVRATDAVGNVGKTMFTWTIDVTPPIATITSRPANPTYSTTTFDATFTFTANEGSVIFTCKLDSFAPALCASPKSYSGLAAGDHTFSVTPTDLAGNVGKAVTYAWTNIAIPK
jgi:hypothetical protein